MPLFSDSPWHFIEKTLETSADNKQRRAHVSVSFSWQNTKENVLLEAEVAPIGEKLGGRAQDVVKVRSMLSMVCST
jgi:hypothetical protein